MSALGSIIVEALKEFLRVLFSPIRKLIETYSNEIVDTVVSTPHPDVVFARPANGAWPSIYDYYWETIVPLSLSLWALAIGLVIFFESTSHLFSGYHRSKLKRRAFTGLLGILSWWWIAAISLRFIDALTGFLVPDLSEVTLFQTLSFSALGALGVAITLATDFVLFVLIALIYFIRQLMLYLFVLLMPILIVLWIPGVGPFAMVSQFMKRLAGFYVPFLFMTVPVALLFRLGGLLGESVSLSMKGFGLWLTALVIPIVAVVSPFILFWQAGALFFTADRAPQHVSTDRARSRVQRTAQTGQTGRQGGQNFLRGVRGQPAVRSDRQTLLGSGDSRAHAVGSRLNSTQTRLRGRFSTSNDGGSKGDEASSSSTTDSRSDRFDALRNRSRSESNESSTRDRRDDADDKPPRYIQ